jgi:hypothetical protein
VGLGVLDPVERHAAHGVVATHTASHVRLVTHDDVSDDDVDAVLDAWGTVARSGPRPSGAPDVAKEG